MMINLYFMFSVLLKIKKILYKMVKYFCISSSEWQFVQVVWVA